MAADDWNWHTEQALAWLDGFSERIYLQAVSIAAKKRGAQRLKAAYGGRYGYVKTCDPKIHITKVNWPLIRAALLNT